MNNKGFTLIELIVTIALLAIISTISFVSITNVIEENKNKTCESIETSLKTATLDYISDNRYNLESQTFSITAQDLLTEHYLTGNIKNPYNNSNLNLNDIHITVKLNDNYELDDKVEDAITVTNLPNNCNK